MTYGDPQRGLHSWTLTEEQSQPFFKQAIELGITHWDTANVYQQGTSEEFVGRAVKRYSRRDHVQIATKVWGRMHDGPTGAHRAESTAHTPRSRTDHPPKDKSDRVRYACTRRHAHQALLWIAGSGSTTLPV